MKSRKARRQEAWELMTWAIMAVAVLVLLYLLIGGIARSEIAGLGPWLGASIGASLGYILTRRQRHAEDDQRRQALATLLLSEISRLEGIVRPVVRAAPIDLKTPLKRLTFDTTTKTLTIGFSPIASYHTATYDSAGASLLLFSAETVYALSCFYDRIYFLRPQLDGINTQLAQAVEKERERDFSRETADEVFTLDLWTAPAVTSATMIAEAVPEVAARLRDEGGMWPRPLPTELKNADLGSRSLPPPVFEVNREASEQTTSEHRLPPWGEGG